MTIQYQSTEALCETDGSNQETKEEEVASKRKVFRCDLKVPTLVINHTYSGWGVTISSSLVTKHNIDYFKTAAEL